MNSNFDIPAEKLNEPGNIWIRLQNNQLRYSTDADSAASWLNPLPVYKASKEIKFGQPVSLTNYSQEHSITESGARMKTVMPTNAIDNSSFIGIAIEYGEESKDVHILNNGELVYEMSKKDNSKYWLPPYHKKDDDFVFDWTDEDVGSTVYITSDGSYTLNVDEVSGGNIMSVGKLVFAPKATETKEKQQKIIIHIQAGGDDRGVKDTAQFTVQMSSIIKPTSIESDYDQLIFVKINKDGLGEIIFNDSSITSDIEASPVGAVMVKSEDGLCDLTSIIGKKITLVRMGLVSGNFGFNPNNVGKIGLLNDGKVSFKTANDYNIKVGLFKSYKDDVQDFLVDCRFPLEGAESGDKIGTIKPVFGPSDDPLLDIGYALVDEEIHRTTFIRNDSVDKSGIDWEDLIKNCYTKDIFEFGRKIDGKYVFSRVLEDFNGKSWSLDIFDTDDTIAILSPETFFKFRNLYYTINSADGIKQVACQIKFTQDSINTNEECIWPEEAYKIKLKATSDKEDYVLGGKGSKSTLFCNISRLVAIGNYMDGNGSNIETYDITVKVQSTGQILSPGFYQNKDGKWCGFEWFIYDNNGLTYLYMSTIPSGIEAKDCNGINTITAGEKLSSSDPEETLIVTVRRRPTLYNAVYLNQYPVNNPWMPYVDGNTGNLITENAIYFGTPSKLLTQNKTGEDDETTSGMEFNEAGRNGKIELTTEDSGNVINLSTQVRGSTNNPTFKDKKQIIKSDGSISNTIEWEYDFANGVTSLNSYFAPILISKKSSIHDVNLDNFNYVENNIPKESSILEDFLKGKDISAIEILDSYYFRNLKYKSDGPSTKSSISIVIGDEADDTKYIFDELSGDISSNRYHVDASKFSEYKDLLYVDNTYINYMSLLSLVGISTKDLYKKILKLERVLYGADFNKHVETSLVYDNYLDYINNIGLLRISGYLKNSLVLGEASDIPVLDLEKSLLPNNNNYFSIIDRFMIENYYNYNTLDDLSLCYQDYKLKNFEDRLSLLKEVTLQKGGNLPQLVITHNDLEISNYSYKIYDFFNYLKTDNSYDLLDNRTFEGSFIGADKIVFKKLTRGYESQCQNISNYKLNNTAIDTQPQKEVYEICDDDTFDETKKYYKNTGKRVFAQINLDPQDYKKNTYYIKKVIDATYSGYPFRWPLNKDEAFNNLDLEYNFFSRSTYGLDDSLSVFDDNDDNILSTFSPQSLEGITFDTISKLSFLYSCFDKNHVFDAKMTWLFPFIVDDYSTDYAFEIRRLSQAKSLQVGDNKTYSAFITKDNKVVELGSLYYDAFKHIFYESNTIESTAASYNDYTSRLSTWGQRLLADKDKSTGIKTTKNTTFTIDIGENRIYTFDIPDDEETYKKIVYLMTQGKLKRIKDLLENDPYNAYKTYGEFFKNDYVISIDISTDTGVTKAKNSIDKYIHSVLNDNDLNILAKFSISPMTVGPVDDYSRLGSYSTIISEIKSLRAVKDVTLSEVQRLFSLISSYQNPITGAKDDVNGNNAYKTIDHINQEIESIDGYDSASVTKEFSFIEKSQGSRTSTICKHGKQVNIQPFKQIGSGFIAESRFTIYKLTHTSETYGRIVSGCPDCISEGRETAAKYRTLALKLNGLPDLTNEQLGTYSATIEPNSKARSEATNIFTRWPVQATQLEIYYINNISGAPSVYDLPDTNQQIFYARSKYLLDQGYSYNDIRNYFDDRMGITDRSEHEGVIKWDDYGLIDYARAAAYGPKNIVFYNTSAYKDFSNISESIDIDFNPKESISEGISNSNNIVDAYNNQPSLKIVWPSEINTYGNTQESITYVKNDINRFISRKISDDTTNDADIGIINVKTNPVARINFTEVENIPDITVAELKQLLVGNKDVCEKCSIDPNYIKEYNIDITDLNSATQNWKIPVVIYGNKIKTLLELRELQFNQIEAQNGIIEDDRVILSTPVIAAPFEAVVYDLVEQGLSFKDALSFGIAILAQKEDITGGFISRPELATTYGLLNEEKFSVDITDDDPNKFKLIGLTVHANSVTNFKDINDFKLKELYNYNDIDQMIIASSQTDYNTLLKNLTVIKNYIELFFEHSDKILIDFSQKIVKEAPVEIKGTTYIDDFVDSEITNNNFSELKNSINSINTNIIHKLPDDKNIVSVDTYSSVANNALESLASSCTETFKSIANILLRNLTLSEDDKKLVEGIANTNITLSDLPNEQLIESITKTFKDIFNKSEFILNMIKPNELKDAKVSKAFNLEKYNDKYDRKNTTGFQAEPYTYIEYLPEYGYLYSKPADGLSIEKKIEPYMTNSGLFHNNLKTIIKHKPLQGNAIQKETFIGDKIEVKEGFYIRSDQLPLPQASLDIKPNAQMSVQRLSYKPTDTDYYSDYVDTNDYSDINYKSINIGLKTFGIIINGIRYTVTAISKVVVEGPVFDILPNGLKLIPTDYITVNLCTSNGQDESTGSSQVVYSDNIHFSGPKIYRNYVYDIAITNPDDTTLLLSQGRTLNMTLHNRIVSDLKLDNSKIISSIPINKVESSGKTRQLSLSDKDLLRDIILNSNIFVFNNIQNLNINTKSVDILNSSISNIKMAAQLYDVKHISEYNFEIVD